MTYVSLDLPSRYVKRRLRACVRELGELAVAPAVLPLQAVRGENRAQRHAELGPRRGEPGHLVEIDLLLLAGHGVLDPRQLDLVDLAAVGPHLRLDPVRLVLDRRVDRLEPPTGAGA